MQNGSKVVGQLTLTDLFLKRVVTCRNVPALTHGDRVLTYGELEHEVQQWVRRFRQHGLQRGQRVALWSENRVEYVEIILAAARLGLIVACLNWRLSREEQSHCIRLVRPELALVSARYLPDFEALPDIHGRLATWCLDTLDAVRLEQAADSVESDSVDPEDGLLILYTSGTTGLPKGAVISQRAAIARAQAYACEYGIAADAFIAWSPFFHMAATDHSLATLMLGGHVFIHDSFNASRICDVLEREPVGWLLVMPGIIEQLIEELRSRSRPIRGVKMVGSMADLVPRHHVAELTRLVNAPYLNTFGSTETGLGPGSGALLPIGTTEYSLSKKESGWCRLRLADAKGNDVPDGTPGDALVRGPSLFSGYWDGDGINTQVVASGWYNMGDMFVRNPDGSIDFVDRSKYLIKSGGENVYPAEIERVLLAHPQIVEAVVVRKPDSRWGEVPVAVVALAHGATIAPDSVIEFCRERLAGYKCPKAVHIIDEKEFPRSSTGKIVKKQIESMVIS